MPRLIMPRNRSPYGDGASPAIEFCDVTFVCVSAPELEEGCSRIFVRDGIHSVADYNSTRISRMGVGVVVVVVVVVRIFTMG